MRDFAFKLWLLVAAVSAVFLQYVGNRAGQHLVSIAMFVANVFATGFLFFSCLQGA